MITDRNLTDIVDATPPTETYDPGLDAGLAAAFGPDLTPGGWSQPPLLVDDPADDSAVVHPASTEMPQEKIERYQFLGEVARGGMGVVLKARDPDLGRDLAVKVLRTELVGRSTAEQRFVEEAQVGGQLQHPGVVPVYDLGRLPDGRPYFAMKLVKGRTLAAELADRPNPGHDRPRFLQIFLQICQTVASAHAKGVIHRDLKPANVMVGKFGEVLVMDWGLAKVLPRGGVADEQRARTAAERTVTPTVDEPTVIRTVRSGGAHDGSDTMAGSVLGTPAFMPPEQAGGEVDKLDERADVFGLGAILAVILTGQPPYVAPTGEAVRLMAVRGQLSDCFARLDTSGADAPLVQLCKQCLAPEPANRPQNADRVAETLVAYQASVVERLRKAEVERAEERVRLVEERRRRKILLALAVAILGLVVVGGGAGFWVVEQRRAQAARVDLALQGAEVLREQAAADPDKPVGRWQDAAAALVRAEDALGDAPPAEAKARLDTLRDAIAVGLKAAEADRNLIEQLDKIRNEKEGKEADEAFIAAFQRAGLDVDALSPDELAGRLAAKPATVRAAAGPALDVWAMFRRDASDEAGMKRLFATARALDPDTWRNTLRTALQGRDLVALHKLAKQADEVDRQGSVYLWLLGLGHALNGDNKGAIEVLRPAQRKYPGDYALNMELSDALSGIARSGAGTAHGRAVSQNSADYQKAEPYLRAAVAVRPNLARARLALAVALQCQGRFPDAEPEYLAAIRLDPTDALLLSNFAAALNRQGRVADARAYYRRALAVDPAEDRALQAVEADILKSGGTVEDVIALYRKAAAHRPRGGTGNLARALERHGRSLEAIALMEKAIAADSGHPGYRYTLGDLYVNCRQPERAVAVFREAVAADPTSATYHKWLAWSLMNKGDVTGAVAAYQDAIRLDPADYYSLDALGRAYLRQGEPRKALSCIRQAVALRPRYNPAHDDLLTALTLLGDLGSAVADYQQAIARDPTDAYIHYRLAIALERKGDQLAALAVYRAALKHYPQYQDARIAVGNLLRRRKAYDEAARWYREAIALEPKAEVYHDHLAVVLEDWGKPDEAITAYRAGIVLNPRYAQSRNHLCDLFIKAGRLDEAAAECERAILVDPRNAGYHYRLGYIRGRQGRPREAVAEHRSSVELEPDNSYYVMHLALALAPVGRVTGGADAAGRAEAAALLAGYFDRQPTASRGLVAGTFCRAIGDRTGYERVARHVLDHYKDTTDYQEIEKAAKLGLLDPAVSGDRLAALTRMAERAVTEGRTSQNYLTYQGYMEMGQGLAAARKQDWAEAFYWCDRALSHANGWPAGKPALEAGCAAIRAIALARKGQPAEARSALAAADKILAGQMDKYPANILDLVIARLLADEARSLLPSNRFEPAPPPRPVPGPAKP